MEQHREYCHRPYTHKGDVEHVQMVCEANHIEDAAGNCWLRGFGRLPSLNEFATDHEHKRPACLMFKHYPKTYLDLVGDRFSVYRIVAETIVNDFCPRLFDISASNP